jgi:glycosyltransferase involved in cell wall biosynthesis
MAKGWETMDEVNRTVPGWPVSTVTNHGATGDAFPRAARATARAVTFAERSRDLVPETRPTSVTVLLPTLNEAENLRHVLPEVASEYEVVIVDGGSTDGTVDVALELRPDAIVVRQQGRGKGDALLLGMGAARGEIIVTLDADGSADPTEIPRYVAALLAGAEFAKGSRYLPEGGSDDLTLLRSLGNRFLGRIVNLLYGTRYTDLCYGYNAFWRSCIPHIPTSGPGFEIETLMHISVVRAGLRVEEVASHEKRRLFGQSNLRPFRDGFRILRVIIRERRTSGLPSPGVPPDLRVDMELDCVGSHPPVA